MAQHNNAHEQQLRLLINNKQDLKEEEKRLRNIDKARRLVIDLDYGNNWFKYQTVKKLYLYLDLDFVKNKLMKLYRYSDDKKLKTLITSMHDGNFDAEEILEEHRRQEEYETLTEEALMIGELTNYGEIASLE
ncbi:MAG: hypothetical protein EBR67_03570 [Proteobacteria bacterium]|nr:hypothetical protein [Pseudomonadota bacterium]